MRNRTNAAISRQAGVVARPGVPLEVKIRNGRILDEVVKGGFVGGLVVGCEKTHNGLLRSVP